MTVGSDWPLSGATVTLKSTPASAELLTEPVVEPSCFELTVTSVRRPTTAEGLTTNTLPLPLDVLIPAFAFPMQGAVCLVHVGVLLGLRVQFTSLCIRPVLMTLYTMSYTLLV